MRRKITTFAPIKVEMFQQPPFRDFPPYMKLLSLMLVVISLALMIMAMGAGLAILIFGKDILHVLTDTSGFDDPSAIAALKFFQVINQFGVFILPALMFVILTDNDLAGYLGLKGGMHRFSIVQGVVLIIVSLPLTHWLLELNNGIQLPEFLSGMEEWMKVKEKEAEVLTDAFLSTSTVIGLLSNLLMIAVLAAVGEELIFRGILVRLFREWTQNIHLAVFIPAFIFSALHLQFYGFLPRLALGMFLGYLFVWTGSLWVPILVHFANNAFAVILSFLETRGWIDAEAGQIGSSSDPWVIVGSTIITLVVLTIIYFHENRMPVARE